MPTRPARAPSSRAAEALSPDAVALIVYTSGTTGMPKGAMLTHRNVMYSGTEVVRIMGLNAKTYSVVCYLPLCHVAERSFSTCMQLLCGSVVNFAESIDTIVVNLREIAPRGFLGVPRIWEKMQQSILFRLRDTTAPQRWVYGLAMRLGRPIAERAQANGGRRASLRDKFLFTLLWLVCFRSLQRFLGIDRVAAGYCGGATVSPEVLLYFWTIGVPVYQIWHDRDRRRLAYAAPGMTRGCSDGSSAASSKAPKKAVAAAWPSIFAGYLFDQAHRRCA